MYFWLLASFFWLNIASFNVWRSVEYQRFYFNDSQLFWIYFAYGWGSPLMFLIAALVVHHAPETIEEMLRPNFAESKCWFHGNLETWAYFYGPVSVLLGMNIIFFLMTVFRLWRLSSCDSAVPGLRSSRFKCVLYLKIFLIMGILWVFEVLSFVVNDSEGFWYITDTLNSLQGVFIFFVVVCRTRVLNGLAKREWGRTIITSVCPRRCLSGPDLEQEEAMLAPGDDETYVAMGPPPERTT
ncbi:hypothetical protein J437_LFUL000115 [Ladona fulva]|uniref:G-protein coupled receptors family 2 profile 2 domain-containing protein n=1 Tax=Ladona fulva TaxID=123851 RepID=A0A8K0K556_LADFU|nr:hypothetical protein J437_LFUL000115 [Ladona fulva]